MHYSNIESFKIIREKYFQKEEDNLLFRIQTLSDLASQKKERLKKFILTNPSNNYNSISTNSSLPAPHKSSLGNLLSSCIKNNLNNDDQFKNSEFDKNKIVINDNIIKKEEFKNEEIQNLNNPQLNINNLINNNKNYLDLMNKIGINKSDPIDFEKKTHIISKY